MKKITSENRERNKKYILEKIVYFCCIYNTVNLYLKGSFDLGRTNFTAFILWKAEVKRLMLRYPFHATQNKTTGGENWTQLSPGGILQNNTIFTLIPAKLWRKWYLTDVVFQWREETQHTEYLEVSKWEVRANAGQWELFVAASPWSLIEKGMNRNWCCQ